jgi:hypothetical protein
MRILLKYFEDVHDLSSVNAWEHVYRCLLWTNESAGLAHIYDSNHMQKGGVFHNRAVRFTDFLCHHWNVDRRQLRSQIDVLFRGCVAVWEQHRKEDETGDDIPKELEGELVAVIEKLLTDAGVANDLALQTARQIERHARHFFTIGKKRMNALGEGFEDLLTILLQRVSRIPRMHLHTRAGVSKLPGFSKGAFRAPGQRSNREPSPDIAITEESVTRLITTAKWSLRQDRETQFASEFQSFQSRKVQSTELRYALITNEFDLARLGNVCRAIPTGAGGYVFHNVYHVALHLLREVHGARFRDIDGYVQTGKLLSLSDYLEHMRDGFGR